MTRLTPVTGHQLKPPANPRAWSRARPSPPQESPGEVSGIGPYDLRLLWPLARWSLLQPGSIIRTAAERRCLRRGLCRLLHSPISHGARAYRPMAMTLHSHDTAIRLSFPVSILSRLAATVMCG